MSKEEAHTKDDAGSYLRHMAQFVGFTEDDAAASDGEALVEGAKGIIH